MRKIDKIIIHCSDSTFGDVEEIRRWHIERGWDDIGYHYVILNGHREGYKDGPGYVKADDGVVETGRPIKFTGAHCKGHNIGSIGLCIIGGIKFTGAQLYDALPNTVLDLMTEHNITMNNVFFHYELDANGKTCPNMDIDMFKKILFGALIERNA